MTPVEILIEARKLIEKPENWTTRYYARTEDYSPVVLESVRACKFCASGAVQRVMINNSVFYSKSNRLSPGMLLNAAAIRFHTINVPQYNDTHSHEDVLKLFDEAIELGRKDEEKEEEQYWENRDA